MVSVPAAPAHAAPSDDLNIAFIGSLVGTEAYTTQGDEVMRGTVHRMAGGETQPETGGVQLAGPQQGIGFEPSQFTLTDEATAPAALTTSFLAEMTFVPDEWESMDTLFAAGGNLFVRAENGRLVYGFDSNDGSWQQHRLQTALPVADEEHALSLRYDVTADGATMRVWLDGEELTPVTSDVPARVHADLAKSFGFGNDVHPQGRDRGMTGTLLQLRVLADPAAQEPLEFQPTALTTDLLDVSFEGEAAEGQYSPSAPETLAGRLDLRPGTAVSSGDLVLDEPTEAATFTAAEDVFGESSLDAAFVTEVEFTPSGDQAALATVLAVGGNLFARFDGGTLQYGYSAQIEGTWQDFAGSAVAPAVGESHVLSLAYVPGPETTTLIAWLDGTKLPTVTGPAPSTTNTEVTGTLSVGNEFTAQAGERAFAGTVQRVRFATLNDAFTPEAFTYQDASEVECEPLEDLQPANYIAISSSDCPANLVAKANAVRPTDAQLDWQELELTAFIHFGINTFYDQEWGDGTEDPARFDPTEELDVDSWVRTLRDTGHRLAILVVKHHDGFLLYPSRYTDHDVASSPWKNGNGDVLREFVEACEKYGMKVGVYMSPADSNQEIKGVYGNGSEPSPRTIPTLVEGDDRAGEDLPTFTYEATDYGAYFLNTLYEVLTEYGQIDEVWFDGAEGNTTKNEVYDYAAFYDMIHQLQPNAVVAVGGRDVRWVGTEGGYARQNEWGPVPISNPDDGGKIDLVATSPGVDQRTGTREHLVRAAAAGADALHWWPTEADMKLTGGWFAHPGDVPKTGEELLRHYQQTVGRNSLMLLNTPPTTTGSFAPESVASLQAFAAERRKAFTADHALGVPVVAGGETTAAITDGNSRSSWASDSATGTVTIDLGEPEAISRVGLTEDVADHGQVVEEFTIEAKVDGAWQEVGQAGTIGVQRIVVLDQPVTASQFRITVTKARAPFSLAEVNLWEQLEQDPGKLTEVHFDCTAPRAGDGSEERPFTSLEQFRDAEIAPGATVVLHQGSCEYAEVPFWGYGTPEQPITVTLADGVAPTFGEHSAEEVFAPLADQGWVLEFGGDDQGDDGDDQGEDGDDQDGPGEGHGHQGGHGNHGNGHEHGEGHGNGNGHRGGHGHGGAEGHRG